MNKKIYKIIMVVSLLFCFFSTSNVLAITSQDNYIRSLLIQIIQEMARNNQANMAYNTAYYYNNPYYSNYNPNYSCTGTCPNVFAGNQKSVQSGQSVYLDATVSNQTGYPLTYSWTCTAGTLSNYNILNPIFYAPTVSYDTSYSCTLTASNYYGSGSSSVSILVKGSNYYYSNYYYYPTNIIYPSVSAGTKKSVQSGQSVYLDATVSNQTGYPLTYSWTCTAGTLSNYNILNPIFYAPTVSYDTNYSCTLTASNYYGSSSSSVIITVYGNAYSNTYYNQGYYYNPGYYYNQNYYYDPGYYYNQGYYNNNYYNNCYGGYCY
jgi:hypothetical protein